MKKDKFTLLVKVVLLFALISLVGIQKDIFPFFNQENIVSSSTNIEDFNGKSYIILDNNQVDFTFDKDAGYYLDNPDLDALGRCKEAKAIVGLPTLAHGNRSSIRNIRPSGWKTKRYDDLIDDKYLYTRGHLIMHALYGNETNVKENLITQTRYSNSVTQLQFENEILDYIYDTGNKVEYHVRPDFHEDELVARGVELQALSEDGDFQIHVYVYNIQPGIAIYYENGDSYRDASIQVEE